MSTATTDSGIAEPQAEAGRENPALDAADEMLRLNAGTLVHRIAGFCMAHENGKVFGDWPVDTIRRMIAYHAAKRTLYYGLDPAGEVTAVLMWYRCDWEDDWSFVQHWHPDRPEGDSIFMAFLFAADTAAFKRLVISLIWQEPDVLTKRLIGVRYKRNRGPERVEYTPRLFNKILKLREDAHHGRR